MHIDRKTIAQYLDEVKCALRKNRYRISLNANRGANRKLFQDYVIDEAMARQILLELDVSDFSEVRPNEHEGYENELLYIFGKDVRLLERYGNKEKTVSLYIKFNKLENCFVIVISFHEQKFPLNYYFK